jgi:hypothetical protein
MNPAELNAFLGRQQRRITAAEAEILKLQGAISQIPAHVESWEDELEKIDGRRIEYRLSGRVLFDATDEGTRGEPVTFQVSQDGPFIMTHYPMVLWKPTAPENTTNFGRWRPVSTYPLPDQVVDTDIIDISYELVDGGSQRNFQNEASLPVISRPDNIVPCPKATLFAPNAAIQFFPTYEAITFDGSTPPTEGLLVVTLIGYRIVNL